jgi:hypothetical protein
MYVETQLSRADVENLVAQIAPVRIHMTPTDEDTHWLELDTPKVVQFVPDRGVRVECTGRVRYSVSSVPFRFAIRSLHVLLRPIVVDTRLYFHLEIEKSDLQHVPDVIDDGIMQLINRSLTPRRTRMVWDFGRTLSAALPLPVRLEPLDEVNVRVQRGEVKVDNDSIRFRATLATEIVRYKDHPSDAKPAADDSGFHPAHG